MAENFDLIFGQNASQQYAWSDNDYQNGWETVGNIPPTAAQFDALQRRSDTKMKELNDELTPLVNANTTDNRQPATEYSEGTIKYTPLLPTGWFLECTVGGITSAGEIVLPTTPAEKDTVVDGTVTWTIRKMGSGNGDGDGVPLGAIIAYSANGELPSGYLLCDGAAYSRTMFPDLFAAIGTTYGAGDGSTTFNVPDYNAAERFCQGSTVAGTVKTAGLPNIEGDVDTSSTRIGLPANRAFSNSTTGVNAVWAPNVVAGGATVAKLAFDASLSNPIYGNSDTVQPNALTARYIIKAFDGQTADSALIDITQYAQELAGKANINGSNMVYHKDVITTSGTYTAPATGLYKITVKGGGGGGAGGSSGSTIGSGGAGGGEGGTTIDYVLLEKNDTISVVVGAGGSGGPVSANGTNGGDSTVTVNATTYIGGGGGGGSSKCGTGGTGTINGCSGGFRANTYYGTAFGANGGGNGGGIGGDSGNAGVDGVNGGGGGGGGAHYNTTGTAGGNGGNGYVWFEYYTPGSN